MLFRTLIITNDYRDGTYYLYYSMRIVDVFALCSVLNYMALTFPTS